MPMRHRTKSAALATASDWIFNYMIVQITPASIGWKTYMIFLVLNLVLLSSSSSSIQVGVPFTSFEIDLADLWRNRNEREDS